MFIPNLDCIVITSSGNTDVYGKPILGTRYKERCAIVKLNTRDKKTAIRADSSASRGAGHELVMDAILIMTKNTKAQMDDVIVVSGQKIKIVGVYPLHDINGVMDHYRVEGMSWSDVV